MSFKRQKTARVTVLLALAMVGLALSASAASAITSEDCSMSWHAGGVDWLKPHMSTGNCVTAAPDGAEWALSEPLSSQWSFYASDNCSGRSVAAGSGFRRFSQPIHFRWVKMERCP